MDEAILRGLNAWALSPVVAAIALGLSSRWMLVVVGGPLAWLHLRQRRFFLVASAVLAIGLSDLASVRMVKPLAARERPCSHLTGLVLPGGCGPGLSFPSAHAANAFSLALAVGPETPLGLWVLIPVSLLVALSRVVLGVHWPSDVLAGAALGALLGASVRLTARKLAPRWWAGGSKDGRP